MSKQTQLSDFFQNGPKSTKKRKKNSNPAETNPPKRQKTTTPPISSPFFQKSVSHISPFTAARRSSLGPPLLTQEDEQEEEDDEEASPQHENFTENTTLEEECFSGENIEPEKMKINTGVRMEKRAKGRDILPKSNAESEFLSTERDRKKKLRQERLEKRSRAKFAFLEDPMDENKRKPNDPDYDPRTLYIPPDALLNMTPFERQYWDIKKKNFDSIVFFKKGKFFELFEKDSEIGQNILGLKITERVSMRMAGMPVTSFESNSAKLLHLGYKIAVVDQTETPLTAKLKMKAENENGKEKNSGPIVLNRQLNKILTPGTIVDQSLLKSYDATYLIGIMEIENSGQYGVCFTDTSTGEFNLGFIVDDFHRTQFRTLIFRIRPKEIVFRKGNLSSRTLKILKLNLVSPILNGIKTPWSLQETVDALSYNGYFGTDGSDPTKWPQIIQEFYDNELVMCTLGLVIGYLKELKIDTELVSLKNFKKYDILEKPNSLILDGKTLKNLEIFENDVDLGSEGTLFQFLCQSQTPFGKRLMKQWLCHPLQLIPEINDRLDAVEDLMNNSDISDQIRTTLKDLPDLERMLSRIHALTSSLNDFLTVLDAFEQIVELMYGELNHYASTFKSDRLKNITDVGALFPDIQQEFSKIFDSFDRQTARKEGKIIPFPGFDEEYDKASQTVKNLEAQLEQILKDQQKYFKSTKVVFRDVGKTRYLLEVPNQILEEIKHPVHFKEKSKTQKVRRFQIPKVMDILPRLEIATEELKNVERNVLHTYLKHFDQYYQRWISAVQYLAEIDCLLSFASCSSSAPHGCLCRPQFVESESPFLEIKNMYHPCLIDRIGEGFIPNDITLGINGEPNVILLTGPNMGGKSTTLRQVCVAVTMAQLGCYVHATSFRATPVDRIFTRIGASDNIFDRQSTFMVELQETGTILNSATEHALIILDELGRGTSTFDGYSIAFAVLDELALRNCRVLFSTHYHMLTEEFQKNELISLYHMDAIVDEDSSDVTFLYKMKKGVCPKSYGMKVAQMAGVPEQIRIRAQLKAQEFESLSALSLYRNYTKQLISRQHDLSVMRQLFGTNKTKEELLHFWTHINK